MDQCLQFLSPTKGKCKPVYLGPNIGWAKDRTCRLDVNELAKVCTKYYAQCLAFLKNSKN